MLVSVEFTRPVLLQVVYRMLGAKVEKHYPLRGLSFPFPDSEPREPVTSYNKACPNRLLYNNLLTLSGSFGHLFLAGQLLYLT